VSPLPWLLGLATALGCITAAGAPMRLAMIPLIVPPQALPSAVGISAIIFNTSRILGPAAGAWLATQSSITTAFFAATALLVCALPFLLLVDCPAVYYRCRRVVSQTRSVEGTAKYAPRISGSYGWT